MDAANVTQPYASFAERTGALLIDAVVLVLLDVAINFCLFGHAMNCGPVQRQIYQNGKWTSDVIYQCNTGGWWSIFTYWLYFAILESSKWQATIGKRVLSIAVTGIDGGRISFWRATGRYWAKFLSGIILLIGFIMAAFTAKKQALHDIIAKTLVIKKGSIADIKESRRFSWKRLLVYLLIAVAALILAIILGVMLARHNP